LARSTYQVNLEEKGKHPEVLAEAARELLRQWGYTDPANDVVYGFESTTAEMAGFFYRQRAAPWELVAQDFYSDWGRLGLGRVTMDSPAIVAPGEVALRMTRDGMLTHLQAVPAKGAEGAAPEADPAPWSGWFPESIIGRIWECLFALLFLLLLRLVLRKTVLVWIAYLLILTPMLHYLRGFHPVLGWFVAALLNSLILWVIPRFGFLPYVVWALVTECLLVPITHDFSAYYAPYGLFGLLLIAGVAVFGFYTSLGGRKGLRHAFSSQSVQKRLEGK